ncbi:MAG: pyrroline-5-carboxylate reductase [bacterium]|nr:pyrroline-5-carboxylate reductase [bacterium]
MKNDFTIGFIGAGKMAAAISGGLINSKLAAPNKIIFYEINQKRKDFIKNKYNITDTDLQDLVTKSSIILFCIKPQNIEPLLADLSKTNIKNKLLVSILAGTKISLFEQYLGTDIRIVRVMPNTPAIINEGMSALSFKKNISTDSYELIKKIFSVLGEIEEVDEKYMDAVTGICGSGPAFFYRLADNIAKAGEKEGLDYKTSLRLAAQTMAGAGKMLLKSEKAPEQLISDVASPGGTTAAGLNAFDRSTIDKEIQNVILKAVQRSKELS